MKLVINNVYDIENLSTVIERNGESMGRDDNDEYLSLVISDPTVTFNTLRVYFDSEIHSLKVIQDNGRTILFDTYHTLVSIDRVIKTDSDEITIILK